MIATIVRLTLQQDDVSKLAFAVAGIIWFSLLSVVSVGENVVKKRDYIGFLPLLYMLGAAFFAYRAVFLLFGHWR